MAGFICLYQPAGCQECERDVPRIRTDGFCCDDCAADHADRVAELEARAQRRRDNEDRFAAAVAELRALGWSYSEIDVHLEWWRT